MSQNPRKGILAYISWVSSVGSPLRGHELDVSLKENFVMTKTMRAAVMGAALAGFLAGTTGLAQDQSSTTPPAKSEGKKSKKAKVEKHACKGQNSCKGNGGCKAGDNGCKAKNSCKGKGGCATDGSVKH